MIERSASRSSRRLAAALALTVATVAPAGAQSLWNASAGSLLSDTRALRAGDLLTIVVDEQSSGEKTGETKLKRDSAFNGQVDMPRVTYPKWLNDLRFSLTTSGSGSSNFDGNGTTTRTDRATAQITARVMRVLDNGNLLIEGRRIVVVHDEQQTIVLSGVVRPYDIAADNTVKSAFVADAEVRIEGRGAISDRQRPGLFQRIFDFFGLF
jgi:flagellar L-ring protein precursor FlgH